MDLHNTLRTKHGCPNVNWDHALYSLAEDWAYRCAEAQDIHAAVPRPEGFGDTLLVNLKWSSIQGTPALAVIQKWYDECLSLSSLDNLKYREDSFNDSNQDFITLMYKSVTHIGMAQVKHPNSGMYVACFYRIEHSPQDSGHLPDMVPMPIRHHAATADDEQRQSPNRIPRVGTLCRWDVVNVKRLRMFIIHRGDLDAVVSSGFSSIFLVICLTALLVLSLGAYLGFYALTLTLCGLALFFAFASLYFFFYTMHDLYQVHILQWRPLHVAAASRRTDVVWFLLHPKVAFSMYPLPDRAQLRDSTFPADAGVRDSLGRTPADVAMEYFADEEMILMLLRSHVDRLNDEGDAKKHPDWDKLEEEIRESEANLRRLNMVRWS